MSGFISVGLSYAGLVAPYGTPRLLHTRRSKRLPRRRWPIVESQAECATRAWRDPDQGIWEPVATFDY